MDFLEMPGGWETPSDDEFDAAKQRTLSALAHPKLSNYYDRTKNYAGTSFWAMGDNPSHDLVPADLLAVTLMSVEVMPHGVRAMLNDGPMRERSIALLAKVPSERTLENATADDLVAAFDFHRAVKLAIANPGAASSNPWVTASKLTARKRPLLIPVRDNVVGGVLGKRAVKYAGVYWQLMRALLIDPEIKQAMMAARDRVTSQLGDDVQSHFDQEPDLRLLDAALWISAVHAAVAEEKPAK